jgi:hypothetical protein
MKRQGILLIGAILLFIVVGCVTVCGTLVGAGIGAIAGDAEIGSAVSMTVGVVVDIFGR